MKSILCFSVIIFAISMTVHAELTPEDLDKIRLIIKEEIKEEIAPLKTDFKEEIASLKADFKEEIAPLKADVERLKIDVARLDERVSGIEKQITLLTNVVYGLIALIVVAIGLPAWRMRRDRDHERKIEALTREVEALKQQQIVSS